MLHSEGQVCGRAHFAQNSPLQGELSLVCGFWSSAFSSVSIQAPQRADEKSISGASNRDFEPAYFQCGCDRPVLTKVVPATRSVDLAKPKLVPVSRSVGLTMPRLVPATRRVNPAKPRLDLATPKRVAWRHRNDQRQ